ncbi:HEAT repeat protein [Ancylostoma caninum]|uniref:HEAT repeat protein n=1 Tax=Ancylostoma caninum TaxID=29170 RepID=A0A368GUX8_ANCCA|nr:HEAT repeat protein [Ancylostoma caninum]
MSINHLVEFLSTEFSCIEDITDEWISSSTEGNYNDFASISAVFTPSFYDDDRATVRLRQLLTNIAEFQQECNDAEIWTEMTKINISGRQLCVLLWYSMEWGLTKNSTFEQFERGALAACAYLHLASINGAKAYTIFNPHLYQKCLGMFRALYRCLTYDARAAATKSKSSRKGKTKKKQQQQQEESTQENVEAEEETFNAASFDKEEVKHLLEESCEALFEIFNKALAVSLSGYSGMAHETALLVRDLGRIDVAADAKVDVVENLREFRRLRRFIDRSFALMHRLIDERHSVGGYMVISRIIYPRLAFWTFECNVVPSSSTIPVSFTVWRDIMVKFVKIRAEMGNMGELMNIFKVLQNLYQRCTDRSDYRTRVAQSVLQVLQVLPRVFHYEFAQRINRFCRTQKVSVRNFTSEIAPLVLTNFDFSDTDPRIYDEFDNILKSSAQASNTTTSSRDESKREEDLKEYEENEGSKIEDPNDKSNSSSEGDSDEDGDQEKAKAKPNKKAVAGDERQERVPVLPALYTCIIRCCIDKASSVRLRAMYHLASLLDITVHHGQLFHHATKMFEESPRIFVGGFTETNEDGNEDEEINENMFLDDSEIVIDNVMLHIIQTGAGDDSAGVRKNSLIAMQVFFPSIEVSSQVESAVECLKERCLDSSLMVRKQAAEVLSHLFATCTRHWKILEAGWLGAVLPMINDREQSVQHLIAQIVTKTVLNPLLGEMDDNSWELLHSIELENNYRRLLIRALMLEHREGNIKSSVVNSLNSKLDTCPDQSDAIWMLLSDLSAVFKVKPQKAILAWNALEDGDPNNRVRYVSKVLAKSCDDINCNTRVDLICDLKDKIENFKIHAPNISSVYLCLAKLLNAVGEEGKGKTALAKVGKRILDDCRGKIRESLYKIDEEYEDAEKLEARETLLIRMFTTIGEAVQFSPQLMSNGLRHFDALKTVLASDICHEEELPVLNSAVPSLNPTPAASRAPSPTHSVSSDGGSSQPTSTSSQGASSTHSGPVIPQHIVREAMTNRRALLTPRVRAYAVLTIGKFCLMDEKIAKATIPVFVKQLRLNPDHVIRNNIALVVCDLCIRYFRYTLMVDRYSPIVAACLKDRSTLIMYRFVSTILDENKCISEYTKFCLRDVLLQQFPDLFESHFIECLMYFNNVEVNCERKGAQDLLDQSQKVCLFGKDNFENRMTIYKFMASFHHLCIRLGPRDIFYSIQLSTYDDGRKFGLMAQICTQILCPLMNGKLKYDNPRVYALVKDALTVMSLKEIKLNMDVGKGPDEEDEPPAAVVAVAKEIVTIAFRKAMLEYVMPTLLDLRAYFNERRSALRKELYAIFRAICREHKEQMDAFLDGDAQLKAEVEYDIRRYEHREKVERALARRRAEEAAAMRRMSRRSFAAPRPNNNDGEDMNTTQRNTSAEDKALDQGPTARGHEIPDPRIKSGRKSIHERNLRSYRVPIADVSSSSSTNMDRFKDFAVTRSCMQIARPPESSSSNTDTRSGSSSETPFPPSSITTSPRATASISLESSASESCKEGKEVIPSSSDEAVRRSPVNIEQSDKSDKDKEGKKSGKAGAVISSSSSDTDSYVTARTHPLSESPKDAKEDKNRAQNEYTKGVEKARLSARGEPITSESEQPNSSRSSRSTSAPKTYNVSVSDESSSARERRREKFAKAGAIVTSSSSGMFHVFMNFSSLNVRLRPGFKTVLLLAY